MLEEKELMMVLIIEYLNDVRIEKKEKRRQEKINYKGQIISNWGKLVVIMNIFCKIV